MDQMTPMTVVVPARIKEACERRAAAERRPLSAYLRNIIQDAVESKQSPPEGAGHAVPAP
jgi:hypothetical protein